MTHETASNEGFERKPDQNIRNLIFMLHNEQREAYDKFHKEMLDLQQKSYKNSVDAVSMSELVAAKFEVHLKESEEMKTNIKSNKDNVGKIKQNAFIKIGDNKFWLTLFFAIFIFAFYSQIENIIKFQAKKQGLEIRDHKRDMILRGDSTSTYLPIITK